MSKPDMKPFPDLLPNNIIETAKQFSSCNLCDGMKGLGIPRDGCMDAEMHPLAPNMKFVGTAMTVGTGDGDNLPIHVALYSSKPGYVMVINGGGCKEYPYFGDIIMSTAKAIGLLAMVVDGYCRDYEGALEVGLPVFAKGLMPRGPAKKNPGTINHPIMCAGVKVNPGDLILGDCDGIAVVPREHINEVLEATAKKVSYEGGRRKTIAEYEKARKEGGPLPDLAPQWVKDMLAK
ncbi:MAG: RraA family protein [Spirochaetia bacterium]|jgi:regulator of RNase E activity RraA|nr:RraA family protein [Spirochaetia bacterium]